MTTNDVSTYQPINQSTYQSTHQLINLSTNQPINQTMVNFKIGDIVEITTQQDGYEKVMHGFDMGVKCEVVSPLPDLKVRRIIASSWKLVQRVQPADIMLITTRQSVIARKARHTGRHT